MSDPLKFNNPEKKIWKITLQYTWINNYIQINTILK